MQWVSYILKYTKKWILMSDLSYQPRLQNDICWMDLAVSIVSSCHPRNFQRKKNEKKKSISKELREFYGSPLYFVNIH